MDVSVHQNPAAAVKFVQKPGRRDLDLQNTYEEIYFAYDGMEVLF